MKCLRGQPITQIDIADDFYAAYERCSSDIDGVHYLIPAFVNGLFACELYLKILVGNKADGLKGKGRHNLYSLYCLLDECEKDILNAIKNERKIPLEKLLTEIGDGFVVWRYLYEDNNEDFGHGIPFLLSGLFIRCYLPEIKKMANDKTVNANCPSTDV